MSRSTLPIILSILIVAGLAFRFIIKKSNNYKREKEWFVDNLNYNFLLKVDTVVTFNPNGNGFLTCSLDSGKLNISTEDSLNSKLSAYKRLKFLRYSSEKEVRIFSGVTPSFRKGDRIYVNSQQNTFVFYRGTKIIRQYKLDESILEVYF